MEEIQFRVIKGSEDSDLMDRSSKIVKPVWPEFMMHDAVADQHWGDLYDLFGQYQYALADVATGNLIAAANSIPISFDGDIGDLPDGGWDWAVLKGVEDFRAGRKPNLLVALQIVIALDFQGQYLSPIAVEIMKSLTNEANLKALVAPVRPVLKSLYPLTPMEDYVKWHTESGELFDPWLRVHLREGAELISVCSKAMRINGTITQWEEWTDLEFKQSGSYIVDGALNPVEIDKENDQGIYIEPNVWVGHPIR